MDWVIAMRRQFSPAGMLAEDGSINQTFFRPKQVLLVDDKKWGAAEKELLYKVSMVERANPFYQCVQISFIEMSCSQYSGGRL